MKTLLTPEESAACIGFWRQGATMEEIVYALDCTVEAVRRVVVAYKEKQKSINK